MKDWNEVLLKLEDDLMMVGFLDLYCWKRIKLDPTLPSEIEGENQSTRSMPYRQSSASSLK